MAKSEKKYLKKAYKILSKRKDIQNIATEVPILGRYVDLAFIKEKNIYTYEFKINDCKRALIQSKDHMLGADYCFICMPPRTFKNEFLQLVMDAGVGLCTLVDDAKWPFKEIIKAKKSKRKYNFVWKNTFGYCVKYSNNI